MAARNAFCLLIHTPGKAKMNDHSKTRILSSEIDKALLDALSVGVAKGADDDAWRGD